MIPMTTKKQRFLFVLGQKWEAEQYDISDYGKSVYIWGNNKGIKDGDLRLHREWSIAKWVIKILRKDIHELSYSADNTPNHSAILPFEV